MNEISPARIGFLVDTARDPEHPYTPDMLPIFEMVAEEYAAQGLLERPVEFVVRAVEGLPQRNVPRRARRVLRAGRRGLPRHLRTVRLREHGATP